MEMLCGGVTGKEQVDGDSSGSWKQKGILRATSDLSGFAINCKANGVHV